MDSIIFYQPNPSSSKPPNGGLPSNPLPELIDTEDDDWEAPTISEILAQRKPKSADTLPCGSDTLPASEQVSSHVVASLSPTNTRILSENGSGSISTGLHLGSSKGSTMEFSVDRELNQCSRTQGSPAANASHSGVVPCNVASKSPGLAARDERKCSGSYSQNDLGDHDANSRNNIECDERRSLSCENNTSVELCQMKDRVSRYGNNRNGQEGGAADGKVYDIFAEYERTFGATREHDGVREKGKDGEKHLAGDVRSRSKAVHPARRGAVSSARTFSNAAEVMTVAGLGYNRGISRARISPPGSMTSRHGPFNDSMLTTASVWRSDLKEAFRDLRKIASNASEL